MAFDPSYFDKNPVTVRRQAGPTVSTGTQARGTQVATKPERNPVTRFGSFAADAFRAVVPQGVRNAIGAGVKLVDTPLSTRFGLAIPDMPGLVDEVGNVLLQELTRPTNALVAFGGAGAAARLGTLGRAGKVAGALVAPISKGGKVQRLAAETAISASARTGAETLNRGLDKLGVDSTPVRVAASIAGGLVGGVAGVRAIEGATRGALGRDLLAIAPQPVRVKTTTAEAGQRIGNLLKARTIDQLEQAASGRANDQSRITANAGYDEFQTRAYRISKMTLATYGPGKQALQDALHVEVLSGALPADVEIITNAFLRNIPDKYLDGLQSYFQSGGSPMLNGRYDVANAAFPNDSISIMREALQKDANAITIAHEVAHHLNTFLTPADQKIVNSAFLAERAALAPGDLGGARAYNPQTYRWANSGEWFAEKLVDKSLRATYHTASPELRGVLEKSYAIVKAFMIAAAEYLGKVGKLDVMDRIYGDIKAGKYDVTERINPWENHAAGLALSGTSVTAKDILREARNLEAKVSFTANLLNAQADNAIKRVGKVFKKPDGNYYVRDANGVPQLLQDVLENPSRYTLTPDQVKAVTDYVALPTLVKDERAAFNVPVKEADLEMGQNYVPRVAIKNISDIARGVRPIGGGLTRGRKEPGRVFDDPLDGVKNGVVYDHPLAAFDAYVSTGLTKAVNNHIADLLVPLSESSSVRVPSGLRAKHDYLTNSLRSLRETAGRLDSRMRTIIDSYLNAAEPNMDALLADLAEVKVRGSGKNAGRDALAMQDEIAKVRAHIKELRPEWKSALAAAKTLPEGRAGVSIQAAPALSGRDFDVKDAKVITEFYTRGRVPVTQVEKAAAGARVVQRVVVPMRSTLDWSSTLNQLGIFLPSHPLTFVKNFVKAAGDMVDPASYERFLAENAADATSHQIAILGRARQGTEFEFGSWLDRVPGLHQANRHFQALTTRNRVDIYNSLVDTAEKSGKALTNVDKDQIGRSLNRLSGIATSRAGDLETLVEFAPNFVRSGIETFVKAGIDGSIEGSLARQYLRNMVISSQALAFGVAAAQGRDPREVSLPFDPKALAKGQIKLNPNFGTIRVGGQDISLYGRWDSLARLAVTSMDSVVRTISEQNAARLMDAAGYGLLSKGSPLVSIASSFAQGATFAGNDPASLLGIAEQTLPFTISGFATDVFSGKPLGPSALGAGASALGAKANESTPFEQLNTAAQLRYNRDYDQLTGGEKQALDATVPNIAQRAKAENERRAARGDNRAQARVEFDKADQSRQEQEGQAYLAYQSGELSPEKFMDLISKYAFEAAKRKDQVNQTLGIEYDTPTDANAALSAWFKTFVDSEIAPGAPDFDVQSQLETELRTRIASGEFGDPGAAIATIDDRKKAAHPAEVQPFIDARERISDSGYYDLADVAFARFAGAAGSAAGEPVATYGGLRAAINRALRTGDIAKARRLKAIDERIQRVVARPKEMLRRRNPQLQADLSMTGAVSELSALSLALGRR